MDDQLDDAAYKKYLEWATQNVEPYSLGQGVEDVSKTKGVGNKIMQGLDSALKFLNTGTGQKLTALTFKNPYSANIMAQQGIAQGEQEKQDKLMRMKSLGELMGKKMDFANALEVAKIGANARLQDANIAANAKVAEKAEAKKTKLEEEADKLLAENKIDSNTHDEMIASEGKRKLVPKHPFASTLPIVGKMFGGMELTPDKNIPLISTQEDYDKLPSGSKYLGEDGKQRTKP